MLPQQDFTLLKIQRLMREGWGGGVFAGHYGILNQNKQTKNRVGAHSIRPY